MLTILCSHRPDTVDALHANGVYGATASSAPIPAGYAVYDNNSNIPFGVYGTWSAAHSKFTPIPREISGHGRARFGVWTDTASSATSPRS